MLIEPEIPSSYGRTPGFARSFYDIVMELKPKKIVEFGVAWGFSSLCMAQALRDLGEGGHIQAYDIYDGAEAGLMIHAINNIQLYGLKEYITLSRRDFYEWIKEPEDFDLLHVDVNNTGDVLKLLAKKFPGKHVIFEGGTPERDEVYWMREGKKTKFHDSGVPFRLLNGGFPGLGKL